jgi:hypothetical protein
MKRLAGVRNVSQVGGLERGVCFDDPATSAVVIFCQACATARRCHRKFTAAAASSNRTRRKDASVTGRLEARRDGQGGPNGTRGASLQGQSRISFGTPPSPHRDPTVTPLLAQGHPKGWPRGLLGWWSGLHGDTCLSPGSTVQAHSNARHARRTTSDPFWDPFCDIDPEFLSITFRQFIAMTD